MLEAAMRRVLAEAAWARKTYPDTFKPTTDEVSVNAVTFATASPKAHSRNCALLASDRAAL
jgi:hypothetical protein